MDTKWKNSKKASWILGWPVRRIKAYMNGIAESWRRFDFTKENNTILLKTVAVNFLCVFLCCIIFQFGPLALMMYSMVLFFLLRYIYNKVRVKYALLLQSTNEIAQGNLETSLEEDLWIFNPIKTELGKIQSGFKNAVEKEIKSQHMKTELITNVSHDLKTPLTAIITYVSLLKGEEDEDKRREYTDILERKSLRLKALIEDLFEISKVSSNNITLNIVDVDVVNLMKQVCLELEDKIQLAKIDFRCNYPGEKICASLDSQITYRIFENLLVNITKYAMPGTRAYIDIFCLEKIVVISMKNVSAAELNFKPEELTERFVRGDRARNTEGSGLGLAIAKSFTELQGGEFGIEMEADLFKVELKFALAVSNE